MVVSVFKDTPVGGVKFHTLEGGETTLAQDAGIVSDCEGQVREGFRAAGQLARGRRNPVTASNHTVGGWGTREGRGVRSRKVGEDNMQQRNHNQSCSLGDGDRG